VSFADPQSITISGTTYSMPRTSVGNNQAEYRSADGLLKLSASHAYGRRTRRVLRFDHSKIAAGLYDPSQNALYSMSNYIVFDVPALGVGYTNADVLAVYNGFKGLFTASTDALIAKTIGGES